MPLAIGATGAVVRALQIKLLALGYPLPRWGADGALGGETMQALALFLADHGHPLAELPGEVTDSDLELVSRIASQTAGAPDVPTGRFFDRRPTASRTFVRGVRSWRAITGITLHQTACVLGEDPERWETIGAHVGVTRGGRAMWLHDFTDVVIHGNGFNGSTVGIECDGMYAGIEGEWRTFWRPASEPGRQPQTPTPELELAARAVIRWVVAEVARHGGRVKHLFAHRQASADRPSDPGSALWQRVAMPAHEELGLDAGPPGYRIGTGLPLPEAWDASRVGTRY